MVLNYCILIYNGDLYVPDYPVAQRQTAFDSVRWIQSSVADYFIFIQWWVNKAAARASTDNWAGCGPDR